MQLEEIFESFNSISALVIGDVMVDAYLWGRVERISPEAPVPVVNVLRREHRLGGAGNVLLNLKSLGANPLICSVIGNDDPGLVLEKMLRQQPFDCSGLIKSETRLTTIKERVMAGSQHVVRIDTETDRPISEEDRRQLVSRAKELMPRCQVVIFEDYDKGVLNEDTIAEVVAFARHLGVPTVVDPKKRNFMAYKDVTLFKPNLKELREGLKIDFNPDVPAELEAAVIQLKEVLRLNGALITLSERGVYIDFDEEKHHIPAHFRNITDVSGAGDTVISIAACAVALNLLPKLLAALSNLGGGLVCEYTGAVPIDKKKLLSEAKRVGLIWPTK